MLVNTKANDNTYLLQTFIVSLLKKSKKDLQMKWTKAKRELSNSIFEGKRSLSFIVCRNWKSKTKKPSSKEQQWSNDSNNELSNLVNLLEFEMLSTMIEMALNENSLNRLRNVNFIDPEEEMMWNEITSFSMATLNKLIKFDQYSTKQQVIIHHIYNSIRDYFDGLRKSQEYAHKMSLFDHLFQGAFIKDFNYLLQNEKGFLKKSKKQQGNQYLASLISLPPPLTTTGTKLPFPITLELAKRRNSFEGRMVCIMAKDIELQ
ncbi:MAG: hypothetical protein EXX96DRAFT_588220 [Benjaminiella poitrasii]|nr:MAG: hypothetical protein EXX96DRAFT_588220 [Benjaminiella poitrasii]